MVVEVKVDQKDKKQHSGESGCTGTKLPNDVLYHFQLLVSILEILFGPSFLCANVIIDFTAEKLHLQLHEVCLAFDWTWVSPMVLSKF